MNTTTPTPRAERAILDAMAVFGREGILVTDQPWRLGALYLPKAMIDRGLDHGYSQEELTHTMQRMIRMGTLRRRPVNSSGDYKVIIALVVMPPKR